MCYVLIFFVALFLQACGPSPKPQGSENYNSIISFESDQNALKVVPPEPEEKKPASDFKPFYIYADKGSHQNHFIPSGFMPDGKCVVFNDNDKENCVSGTCIKIIFDIPCAKEGQKWAGIYWQYPANNWGQRKGGFNLKGATRLVFWARGEKGGEQIQEFLLGGILGTYPDSDMAMIGPVLLTSEWKEYSIDLRGKDLSYINGGFAWSANVDGNPESCIFYLDDIHFE
jgi:hypothetical protein